MLLLDIVGASVAPRSWTILASGGRRDEDLAMEEVNSALWREAHGQHLHNSCRMYYALLLTELCKLVPLSMHDGG